MHESFSKTCRAVAVLLVWLTVWPLAAGNAFAANQALPTTQAAAMAAWLDTTDPGITFTFDANVSAEDRDDIIEGTRLGLDVIGQFVGTAGLDAVEIFGSASASSRSPYIMAATGGQRIEVYTGSGSWQMAPALIRIETMVHELMHVYQSSLEGSAFFSVPLWFDEGTAEALGYLAITQLGVVDQNDIYDLTLFQLTRYPVAGSLAALTPFGSMTADSYPLAYIAVQYLLGRSGMSVTTLAQVYEGIDRGSLFGSAFADVFGQSLDEFYVEFDQWRTGLLSVTSSPLDFVSPHWNPGPVSARWSPVQAQVEPGQQLVLAVVTQPGAQCVVRLSLADQPIERNATASGSGSALWLVTIPDRTPKGFLSARASCGDAAIWQEIAVV